MTARTVLEVKNLVMNYEIKAGMVSAVENVSFSLPQGKSLGLVGESGCGKTSVALTLLRLQAPNARILGGEVLLDGENLLDLSSEEMRKRRWSGISMVFQGAMNSWNPVYTVGDQILEAIDLHWDPKPTAAKARAKIVELFGLVGLNPDMIDRYPHEYSGGMKQRAVIAMALSCDPRLIIADEPTTALDVIVQEQILAELKKIQEQMGMSIIYISHDIAVIAEITDLLGVMYAGKLVEVGPTVEVFARPRHPYTWLILSSTPSITGERRQLAPLEGEPPNLLDPPTGCRFHPRCPFATELCVTEEPPLAVIDDGHSVACWHHEKVPVGVRSGR
ncbi:MAG: ABC transporter ATP-binding protein [Actinobacteria bacterium]|nr:ABC transporter ATP-binding protein [Actinomycetota bacterium]MCI0543789.1 ABC transporter ATP-binding protein [Actinomycetota bacterium]MCI0678909.1 ABC transporter ATP-binding protein [Actinomycetota bacterium]